LEIIKVANKDKVKVGDLIVWTITVINHGPDKAVNVRVSDMIDVEKCEPVSYKTSKGGFDLLDGDWIIGNMEVGEKATLQITVKALYTGELVNYAYVTSDTPDPNPDNDESSAKVIVVDNNPTPDNPGVPQIPTKHSNLSKYATGNPVVMVLLALLAIVGVTLRRKN
jgi:uncharacterized repeat protein (TIGR01451 family)